MKIEDSVNKKIVLPAVIVIICVFVFLLLFHDCYDNFFISKFLFFIPFYLFVINPFSLNNKITIEHQNIIHSDLFAIVIALLFSTPYALACNGFVDMNIEKAAAFHCLGMYFLSYGFVMLTKHLAFLKEHDSFFFSYTDKICSILHAISFLVCFIIRNNISWEEAIDNSKYPLFTVANETVQWCAFVITSGFILIILIINSNMSDDMDESNQRKE